MAPLALLILVASSFCMASGQKYLFSFGDSYTDTGFNINGSQPSPNNPLGNPRYPSYTQSGGPDYIDFLTVKYNNSLVLSYNFAMSGATISDSIVAAVSPDIHSFQQQVENYYKPKYSTRGGQNAPWAANNAIFLIFIGINDINLSYQGDPSASNVSALLHAYFHYVDDLHATGARNFLFVNIPPFDRSPPNLARGAHDATNCSKYINTFNKQLARKVEAWSTGHSNSTMTSFYDFHSWMTQVLNLPQTYGFKNATCAGAGDSDCVWWASNPLHTTSHLQRLLSQDMLASLAVLGWCS